MTRKQAALVLGCTVGHVSCLTSRGKLKLVDEGVSDRSVYAYVKGRRAKRLNPGGVVFTVKHISPELIKRMRDAVPNGSSLVNCVIEAFEFWLRSKS